MKSFAMRDRAGADVPAQTIVFNLRGELDENGDTEMILNKVKALAGEEENVQSLCVRKSSE